MDMQIRHNKLIYQDKPRLKTALEMLRTSMSLEDSLHEVRSATQALLYSNYYDICDPLFFFFGLNFR